MKRLVGMIALGFAFAASPAFAADATAKAAAPAKVAAAAKKSMAPDGSFHAVHTKKLKLDCGTCHTADNTDVLFLRNTEAPPQGLQAQVDRNGCLACHRAPAKPAWYGASAR